MKEAEKKTRKICRNRIGRTTNGFNLLIYSHFHGRKKKKTESVSGIKKSKSFNLTTDNFNSNKIFRDIFFWSSADAI